MGSLLVNIFYLARPILSVQLDITIAGMDFFDVATIVFTSLLGMIAAYTMMNKKAIPLSAIEKWIIAFIIWCTLIYIFYREIAVFKTYIKLILAPITYLILRRTITSAEQYIKALKCLIVGFSLPVVWSAFLIAQGHSLARTVYWTGLERYQGVYATIHDMAHSMALVLMLIVFHYYLKKGTKNNDAKSPRKIDITFTVGLALSALYCLYHSQGRTAFLGLFIFMMVFSYLHSKKGIVLFTGTTIAVLILAGSLISTIFFDVVESAKGERDVEHAGSGRLYIWNYNLNIYSDLPFDRKILGLGIGNKIGNRTPSPTEGKQIYNSHNDWLQTYFDTGPIGFIIILGLYISILIKILRLPTPQRHLFLAFYIAVIAMNFGSNSYISRFALSQMFYMTLIYIELPRTKKSGPMLTTKPKTANRILHKKQLEVTSKICISRKAWG